MNFSEFPISCYIRTLNEERMIGDVISSAKKICSEVVIIDSLSIDKTKSIALSLGASVYEQPWLGWGNQKRVGEERTKNNWVWKWAQVRKLTKEEKEDPQYEGHKHTLDLENAKEYGQHEFIEACKDMGIIKDL